MTSSKSIELEILPRTGDGAGRKAGSGECVSG
jgi:hypothetical protein